MKYILTIFILTCGITSFGQDFKVVGLNDSTSGRPGRLFTLKPTYTASPLLAVNDSTLGMDTSRYYISTFAPNAGNDSLILTFPSRRLAAKITAGAATTTLQQAITNGNTLTKKDTAISSSGDGFYFKGSILRMDTLSVGNATPTDLASILGTGNTGITVRARNSSAGTTASVQVVAQNDQTNGTMTFRATSSTFTTSGVFVASAGSMVTGTDLTGGEILGTSTSAPLIMVTNGSEAARFLSNGHLSVGGTNDLGVLTVTGAGSISTSTTSPIIIGGTTTSSTLILRSTSGVGATDAIIFQGVNNGGTEFARFLNSGNFGIGDNNPSTLVSAIKNQNAGTSITIKNTTAGTAAAANVLVVSDAGTAELRSFGSLLTPAALNLPNTMKLEASSGLTAGMVIATDAAAPIIIGTNNAEVIRILSGGNLGLGLTAPTALLHIKAGTATASTAPLKFTSGTNLTTAEAGAMEFNGSNLFFTPTGTIRKVIPTNVNGRSTAQTAAVASVVTQTVGASDATYFISANVLVTTATVHSFTVTCTYTDEGNTSRTVTLTFSNLAGTLLTAIANAAGTVPYEGVPLHIRAKAATTITLATTGTFTTVVYNVEGNIIQTN